MMVEQAHFEAAITISDSSAVNSFDSEQLLFTAQRQLTETILQKVRSSIVYSTERRPDYPGVIIKAVVMLPMESKEKVKQEVEQQLRQEHIVL